ncbi:hypothetical protein IKG60_02060 [Candidatus Saccharibacteria bacterium]|nr:hypothetical protein [Candidatus Saccharibacteria bacterium]
MSEEERTTFALAKVDSYWPYHNAGSPVVGAEQKSRACSRFFEATPDGQLSLQRKLIPTGSTSRRFDRTTKRANIVG